MERSNKVRQLLRLMAKDEAWHAEQEFSYGLAYLEKKFVSTPELIPLYSYHEAYWQWWKGQYERRCEMLLIYCENKRLAQSEMVQRYHLNHAIDPSKVHVALPVENIIKNKISANHGIVV